MSTLGTTGNPERVPSGTGLTRKKCNNSGVKKNLVRDERLDFRV